MCAQFLIRDNLVNFAREFPALIPENLDWKSRVYPRYQAPIVVQSEKGYEILNKQYSLIPHWSKTEKPKFATYNARLESIDVKPTWRDAFKSYHCLVPMNGFVEWVETDDKKKKQILFTPSTQDELMVAAGIYTDWSSPEGDTIPSFAIITKEPNDFILDHGHDRMPIFLTKEKQKEWLQTTAKDPEELKRILLEEEEDFDFNVEDLPSKAKNGSKE